MYYISSDINNDDYCVYDLMYLCIYYMAIKFFHCQKFFHCHCHILWLIPTAGFLFWCVMFWRVDCAFQLVWSYVFRNLLMKRSVICIYKLWCCHLQGTAIFWLPCQVESSAVTMDSICANLGPKRTTAVFIWVSCDEIFQSWGAGGGWKPSPRAWLLHKKIQHSIGN